MSAPSLRAKVSLVVFGVGLALILGEGIARLSRGGGYDDSVHRFADALVEPDANLSHRLVPDAHATIDGVEYRVSSFGTRGAEPAAAPPHRTLVLGDSVTMGWGVAEAETWPARIEASIAARRPGAEVVNAAVLGWGVEQYVTRLQELAPRLTPDLVLVGYFPNDPGGTEGVVSDPRGPSELWRLLRRRLPGGPRPVDATAYHRALHAEGAPSWGVAQRSFSSLGRLCGAGTYRCGLVLLPSLIEEPYPLAEEHRRIAALTTDVGLAVFDVAPSVAGVPPSTLWVAPDDTHPNAAAHGRYADAIAAWLEVEEL